MTNSETRRSAMDRRTLIKRGAAAGAAVWVAPVVLGQSTASAAGGFCTPKCYGEAAITGGRLVIACGGNFDGTGEPGKKWVGLEYYIQGSCGCAEFGGRIATVQVANVKLGDTPLAIFSDEVFVDATDPLKATGQAVFKKVNGEGAVGDTGSTAITGTISVSVICNDSDGDELLSQCATTFSFTWNPGDGNCGDEANLEDLTFTDAGCVDRCLTETPVS